MLHFPPQNGNPRMSHHPLIPPLVTTTFTQTWRIQVSCQEWTAMNERAKATLSQYVFFPFRYLYNSSQTFRQFLRSGCITRTKLWMSSWDMRGLEVHLYHLCVGYVWLWVCIISALIASTMECVVNHALWRHVNLMLSTTFRQYTTSSTTSLKPSDQCFRNGPESSLQNLLCSILVSSINSVTPRAKAVQCHPVPSCLKSLTFPAPQPLALGTVAVGNLALFPAIPSFSQMLVSHNPQIAWDSIHISSPQLLSHTPNKK